MTVTANATARGRAALGGWALVAAACLPGQPVEPPPVGTSGTSIIVQVGPAGPTDIFVLGAGDPMPSLAIQDGRPLWTLGYPDPPELLQLPRGRISLPTGSRALPLPETTFLAQVIDGGFQWTSGPVNDDISGAIRVSAIDAEACLAEGGCLTGQGEELLCTSRCGPAQILPPSPPMIPCPGGWGMVDEEHCAPSARIPEPCPDGQRYDLTRDGCVEVGACGSERFAVGPEVDAVFVDATASGGVGTREQPYSSLAEAWPDASGRPIVLAPGRYPLDGSDAQFRAGRTVIGRCPRDTTIAPEDAWQIFRGQATLRGLSLDLGDTAGGGLETKVPTLIEDCVVTQGTGVALTTTSSTLTVVRSTVRATSGGLRRAILARRSRVHIEQVSASGSFALDLGLSRGSIFDSVFFGDRDGEPYHVVRGYLCDDLDLRNVRIRWSMGNGGSFTGSRLLEVEDLHVYDVFADGLKIEACDRRFHCRGSGDTLECPPACRPSNSPWTTAQVRRLYVEDTEEGDGLAVHGVKVTVEDAAFLRLGDRGIDAVSPPDLLTDLTADRVFISQPLGGGFEVSGIQGPAEATIRDLTIVRGDRARLEAKPSVLAAAATLSLTRAHIEQTASHGVEIQCGPAMLHDIELRAVAGAGILVAPRGDSTLLRVAVHDSHGFGVDVESPRPLVSALGSCENTGFEGASQVVANNLSVQTCRSCTGGARVAGDAALHLEDFSLQEGQEGLRIEGRAQGRFVRGRIQGAAVGVSLPVDRDLAQTLDRVVIEDSPVSVRTTP